VLAAEAGLDRTYISAVERGRQNLTVGALLSLAQALDAPIADLLAPEGDGA
jgi:transcriptional regulator with XRE-family HTH domain